IKNTSYLPDIHLYVDTSGSMSVEDYQMACVMLMEMAHRADVNIYFSSFSDVLSQELLLPTKGRSRQQMATMIAAVPKVTGGTDYHQIWENINASPVRQQRMNIVLTDFEFLPRSGRKVDHPRNIFYAPTVPGSDQRS